MKDQITLAIVPVAYALTEAYKYVMKRLPMGMNARQCFSALIPVFAVAVSVGMALWKDGVSFDNGVTGILVGLATVGIYGGMKHSYISSRKMFVKPVTPSPNAAPQS